MIRRSWHVAFLALLILCATGPSRADGARATRRPASQAGSSQQAAAPAPVCAEPGCTSLRSWKAIRPTIVYALPDLKSRVLFLVKPGETVNVARSAVRLGDAAGRFASRTCCTDGIYDPDQQLDVVNHVGEGYAPVFHERVDPTGAPSAMPQGCLGGSDRGDCGNPVALREPGNLGWWVQVISPDGRHRGWTLVPGR